MVGGGGWGRGAVNKGAGGIPRFSCFLCSVQTPSETPPPPFRGSVSLLCRTLSTGPFYLHKVVCGRYILGSEKTVLPNFGVTVRTFYTASYGENTAQRAGNTVRRMEQ